MSLIVLIIVVIVLLALALYAVTLLPTPPIDAMFKSLISFLCVIIAILVIAARAGLLSL